jgi:hypothetical protein
LPSEATGNAEAEIRPRRGDADLSALLKPVDHAGLPRRELAPGGDRIGPVEHAGHLQKGGELVGCHVRVLGMSGGRKDRRRPAKLTPRRTREGLLPELLARATPDRLPRGIDCGERSRVAARKDVDGNGRFLTQPPFERRDMRQLLVGRECEEVRLRFAEGWQEDRVCALAQRRAVDRPQQGLGEHSTTDGDLISGRDPGRIVDEDPGPAIE